MTPRDVDQMTDAEMAAVDVPRMIEQARARGDVRSEDEILAALLLGVPLAGTIAVVTFVTAYVPYIGAFVAGAFAVLLALGGQGTGVAVAMLVVVLLANGLLQNLVQPFAMGSALDLNPLVVLVVTIGAGCLFGMIGLVLGAPLVSAVRQISRELAAARHASRLPAAAAEAAA